VETRLPPEIPHKAGWTWKVDIVCGEFHKLAGLALGEFIFSKKHEIFSSYYRAERFGKNYFLHQVGFAGRRGWHFSWWSSLPGCV